MQSMGRFTAAAATLLLLLFSPLTASIDLDLNDPESIKAAASNVAYGLVSYYSGNDTGGTPGVLPYPPYYWWESGAMWSALIDYWYYTGDTTYNNITLDGMMWQVGPGNAFIPTNQSFDEGNDDQIFWAFASMSAAEYNFPNPPADEPQWLALTQAVFNSQAARWDYGTCGGGLRWQFDQLNVGWTTKTSACNAGFFNVAARLGAYTGNHTYFYWANKAWDWMIDIHLISPDFVVYDNTATTDNCSLIDQAHYTYTTGMALNGAAVMWNQTQDETWRNRTMLLWNNCLPFYFTPNNSNPPMVMREPCELTDMCDLDDVSFKGYLARFAAASTKVASWLYPHVKPYLAASAKAAAAQCDGGTNHSICGYHWDYESKWDGTYGAGQQIAALEVIAANLIHISKPPVSSHTGGTSQGDPSAGTQISGEGGSGSSGIPNEDLPIVSVGDKAGAGVLTGVLVLATVIVGWWMVDSPAKPPVRVLTEKTPKA